MALTNFRDLSSTQSAHGAGFQFEFHCQSCTRAWKSPFKPYKAPALAALAGRVSSWITPRRDGAEHPRDLTDDPRARQARETALTEAAAQAERLYQMCPECRHAVCADCWSAGRGVCAACASRAGADARPAAATPSGRHPLTCPNCLAPSAGGRFCGACGYDMAITHKTCPTCGAMLSRQARFCTDCGHGF